MKSFLLHVLLHHHETTEAFQQPSKGYDEAVKELQAENMLDADLQPTRKGTMLVHALTSIVPPEPGRYPRTTQLARYRKSFYVAIASLVADDKFLDLTPGRFVGEIMKRTYGTATPAEAQRVYDELIDEAFSPLMREEHSHWLEAETVRAGKEASDR